MERALCEYIAIVRGLATEYARTGMTVATIRADHPELGFLDDEEVSILIRQAAETAAR